ncbi:hypothetical protein TNCV_2339861 [Trichonephila clavipes]|nr:hypothetical protein TNCV_2339861 [Trichonephila clavipes]
MNPPTAPRQLNLGTSQPNFGIRAVPLQSHLNTNETELRVQSKLLVNQSGVVEQSPLHTGLEDPRVRAVDKWHRLGQQSSHNNTILPLLPVDLQFEIPCCLEDMYGNNI